VRQVIVARGCITDAKARGILDGNPCIQEARELNDAKNQHEQDWQDKSKFDHGLRQLGSRSFISIHKDFLRTYYCEMRVKMLSAIFWKIAASPEASGEK
jgi:hypothetical protein